MDAAELPAAHESCMQLVARYKEMYGAAVEQTKDEIEGAEGKVGVYSTGIDPEVGP